MLGAVHCSFHREIPPYAPYEMWSRILSWDRKWLYIVTHYVPKDLGRPSQWLDPRFKKLSHSGEAPIDGWDKKMYATAVSKYVFKLGRLTIHPATVLAESGLLPERPGGWVVNNPVISETPGADQPDNTLKMCWQDDDWSWNRVEQRRIAGMRFAEKFGAMDSLQKAFDGGQGAVVGHFGPG